MQPDYRGGFIEDEDLGLPQERPRQADELPLSHAQVLAALGHDVLEAVAEAVDKLLEVGQLEGAPHLVVGVGAEGVQVDAQGPAEEHGVLRDDGELRSELVQSQIGDGDVVDGDGATRCVDRGCEE